MIYHYNYYYYGVMWETKPGKWEGRGLRAAWSCVQLRGGYVAVVWGDVEGEVGEERSDWGQHAGVCTCARVALRQCGPAWGLSGAGAGVQRRDGCMAAALWQHGGGVEAVLQQPSSCVEAVWELREGSIRAQLPCAAVWELCGGCVLAVWGWRKSGARWYLTGR